MTVARTSVLAYRSIEDLGDKQRQVYYKIKELQPCDNRKIAKSLKWEINRVTGRVSELKKMNFIKIAKYDFNDQGRMVKMWEVINKDEQTS